MALHKDFPSDPHAILDPSIRWFPADEALRDKRADQLMPPLVSALRKIKVLSLVLAWSFFHKLYEPDSTLARNFLVIAPNIIVLDRIYKDFQGPVLPDNGFDGRNWRDDFQLTLHVQDEVRVVRKTGNIFLTNIHRVYAGNETVPSADDEDTMDYFLGKRLTGGTTDR
jgi:type III restriction enzyme